MWDDSWEESRGHAQQMPENMAQGQLRPRSLLRSWAWWCPREWTVHLRDVDRQVSTLVGCPHGRAVPGQDPCPLTGNPEKTLSPGPRLAKGEEVKIKMSSEPQTTSTE